MLAIETMSKHEVERGIVKDVSRAALISITCPGEQVQIFNNFSATLNLVFDDCKEKLQLLNGQGSTVLFSESQAKTVLHYLNAIRDMELLIIHCHAGISRSKAVALFAHIYYGIDVLDSNSFRNINTHVFSILLDAAKSQKL